MIEPLINIASIGSLAVLLVIALIILKIGMKYDRWLGVVFQKDMKYEAFEEEFLDRLAKSKGIDLNKKLIENDMFKRKDFRRQLEQEIFKEAFEKVKKGGAD